LRENDCLSQTACFARGDKRNDGSTFVLLSFRIWRKSKPPTMRVVVDSVVYLPVIVAVVMPGFL